MLLLHGLHNCPCQLIWHSQLFQISWKWHIYYSWKCFRTYLNLQRKDIIYFFKIFRSIFQSLKVVVVQKFKMDTFTTILELEVIFRQFYWQKVVENSEYDFLTSFKIKIMSYLWSFLKVVISLYKQTLFFLDPEQILGIFFFSVSY